MITKIPKDWFQNNKGINFVNMGAAVTVDEH